MTLITKMLSAILSLWFIISATFTPAKKPGNWQFTDIPEYKGGKVASVLYDAGSGREPDWKDASADNNNYVQFVSKTTLKELTAYTGTLEAEGFTKIFENKIEDNYFYAFIKGDRQLYISFNSKLREARIMDNSCSDRIDEFGYTEKGDLQTSVYQYNFPYYDAHVNTDDSIYSRNGMCYIIRLSDGRLVVIDGGSTNQSAEENIRNLVAFMHELTGTEAGEKINIALWYGTHPHSDHILVMSKALNMFPDEFNIERLAYNYQSYANCEYDHRADWYRQQTNMMFPDAKYMKIRSGMEWDLADAHFQVLCTHEESVSAVTGISEFEDANDCSSVVKITINGVSFLFTGDADLLLQNTLLSRYSDCTLHTDVLQGPHHMLNNVALIYFIGRPTYVFASQSKIRTTKDLLTYKSVKLAGIKDKNILYASEGTYGITPTDGKVEISFRPADYVPFDHSDFSYNFK